ncbi:MAG: hypothetical protein J5529_00795 [Prevotella sp.]|nr:hypothetical protein [Prevotella sp.]
MANKRKREKFCLSGGKTTAYGEPTRRGIEDGRWEQEGGRAMGTEKEDG